MFFLALSRAPAGPTFVTIPGCLVCLALAATAPAPTPGAPAALDAPVVAVTVFGYGARVTRAVRLARWPSTRFLLPRLPAGADPDSVRVEVRGERARRVDRRPPGYPRRGGPRRHLRRAGRAGARGAGLARARQEAEFLRKLAGTRGDGDDEDSGKQDSDDT